MPILLVEDEHDSVVLIQDALGEASFPYSLHLVETGEEAVAYLAGEGKFMNRDEYPFPFLLLLDLKMPGIGGFGVLRWLRSRLDLMGRLKVVIVSAVRSSREIEVVYELGAHFFWPKSDCHALQETIRCLQESWSALSPVG